MIDLVREVVEDVETGRGRLFDIFIQVLIVVSLFCFALETLPGLTESQLRTLSFIEATIVIIFTIEYVLRICVAESKPGYLFSFFGVIDLLSILPFYLAMGVDLRHLRIFRLLRVVRVLKLARYSSAARRIHKALLLSREEIVLYLLFTLILLYLAAVGIYYFEHKAQPEAFASIFHSLYWSGVTLTTLGYGDIYPITIGGRVFTFVLLIIGLGVVSIPAGIISSSLSKVRDMED